MTENIPKEPVAGNQNAPAGAAAHAGNPMASAVELATPSDPFLFRDLCQLVRRRLYMPFEDALIATAFILATHATKCHAHYPRLMFWSPVINSGKTKGTELCEDLAFNPVQAHGATDAALVRVPRKHPDGLTVIIDEFDNWFKNTRDQKGIFNLGYEKGKKYLKNEPKGAKGEGGWEPGHFTVQCFMVLGSLREEPVDGMTRRTIKIYMEKAPSDWKPTKFAPGELDAMHKRLRLWASKQGDMSEYPVEGVQYADLWRPLIACAATLGMGAELLAIARGSNPVDLEEPIALLRDIRAVMGDADKIHTTTLIRGLDRLEQWEMKFADLQAKNNAKTDTPINMWLSKTLGPLLKANGILRKPENIEIDGKRLKGWRREWFLDAWSRHLPAREIGRAPARPEAVSDDPAAQPKGP